MILSDIPQVIYRTDIHTTAMFEAVRNKVKDQVSGNEISISMAFQI